MTDREKLAKLLNEAFIEAQRQGNRTTGYVADHLLANGVTVQEWIPVEERLPEEKQSVLVHYVDGWMPVAFLLNGEWYQSGGEKSWLSVTHWMPLPEPPEEE